jgi:hypothetical protein
MFAVSSSVERHEPDPLDLARRSISSLESLHASVKAGVVLVVFECAATAGMGVHSDDHRLGCVVVMAMMMVVHHDWGRFGVMMMVLHHDRCRFGVMMMAIGSGRRGSIASGEQTGRDGGHGEEQSTH